MHSIQFLTSKINFLHQRVWDNRMIPFKLRYKQYILKLVKIFIFLTSNKEFRLQ